MSLISWIGNLFGHRWTNEEVVQYTAGDSIDHGFDDYSFQKHITLLRNRRPSLHHTQRLIVDSKIRELEASLAAQIARDKETARRNAEANQAQLRQSYREATTKKTTESSKPVAGNVIAKPPKFSVDDDAPTSDFKSWGHTSPTSSVYHAPSSHSHSHSCSGSSHSSSSDSGSSSSDSGGGGCD